MSLLLDQPSAVEQLRSVPLQTLAKASAALTKRKRYTKSSQSTDQAKEAAKQAMAELKGRRKGRTELRFAPDQVEGISATREIRDKPKYERKQVEHRSNKHAPMVQSSKRAVGRARTVVDVPKIVSFIYEIIL